MADAEVVSVFRSYFAERAANGVMYGRVASSGELENRVPRVTFDPALNALSQRDQNGQPSMKICGPDVTALRPSEQPTDPRSSPRQSSGTTRPRAARAGRPHSG